MKKSIRLTVNGRAVSADVEPRLQLADFLRERFATADWALEPAGAVGERRPPRKPGGL